MTKFKVSYTGGGALIDNNLNTFSDISFRDIAEYRKWSIDPRMKQFAKPYVGHIEELYEGKSNWIPPNSQPDIFPQEDKMPVNLGYLIPLIQLALFDIQFRFLSNPYALTYCDSSKFRFGDDQPKLNDLIEIKLNELLFPTNDIQEYIKSDMKYTLWIEDNWNDLLKEFNKNNHMCFLIQFHPSKFIPPILGFIVSKLEEKFDVKINISDDIGISYELFDLNFLNKDYDKRYYKDYDCWNYILSFFPYFPLKKQKLTLIDPT